MGKKSVNEMKAAIARTAAIMLTPADRVKWGEYNPDEARDAHGQWTGGGASEAGGTTAPSQPGAGLQSSAAHPTQAAGPDGLNSAVATGGPDPKEVAAELAQLQAQLRELTREALAAESGKGKGKKGRKGRKGRKSGKGKGRRGHTARHKKGRLPFGHTRAQHSRKPKTRRFAKPRKWEGQNLSGQTGHAPTPHGKPHPPNPFQKQPAPSAPNPGPFGG